MPRSMTPKDAAEKTCPFMNRQESTVTARCQGTHCMCWGWTDPERGQLGQERETIEVITSTGYRVPDIRPDDTWSFLSQKRNDPKSERVTVTLYRMKVIGERRGQCEAMSPYIEVNCND